MTNYDCTRWAEITDRVALGEALTRAESHFESQHRKACPACAHEARIWSALGESLKVERNSDPALEASPGDVAALGGPVSRVLEGRRMGMIMFAGLGLLGAAAALALVFWTKSDDLHGPDLETASKSTPVPGDPSTTPDTTRLDLLLVSGSVTVQGTPASAGATLGRGDRLRTAEGRACVAFSSGTSACLDRESALYAAHAAPAERRLLLESGSVACQLDRQPEGTVFRVDTKVGTITAKGTAFAVTYLDPTRVEVRLHHGVIEVKSKSGSLREVRAPGSVVMSDTIVDSRADPASWERDRSLIDATSLWSEGTLAPLDVTTNVKDAEVTLAGVPLGKAPVSMLVSRGDHDLVVTSPGYLPHQEVLPIRGASRIVRAPQLSPASDDPTKSAVSHAGTPSRATAPELFAQASARRQAGDYRGARDTYQTLLAIFPKSGEAKTALLSLAELQLSQLGAPADALRSFDSYLSTDGPLRQEAAYGRIRALRSLGRTGDAKSAAVRFIEVYPGTPQAVSLQQWLNAP